MSSISMPKECFDGIDWFHSGSRGSGRTYVSCVAALVGLMNGQHETYVLDHHPYHEGNVSYVRHMINALANQIELEIEMRKVRNGFVIRLAPEYVQYEYDQKKNKK